MEFKKSTQAVNQKVAIQRAMAEKTKKTRTLYKRIAIAAFSVVAVAVLSFLSFNYMNAGIKSDQYQAVFLSNGQVYFGKLGKLYSKYAVLTDVYYLQVQNDNGDTPQDQTQDKASGEPQLVKLGEELHGPEDEMKISKDQITFWENLKSDSKIVTAIEEYKKRDK